MAIQNFNINFPGQNNEVVPRIGHLYDPAVNKAAMLVAGYINPYMQSQGFSLLPTDVLVCVASDGPQWVYPVFGVGGVVTLTAF